MPESSLQSLGRYIVHAELGHGGFATVYRATDSALEREVALKVLKPGWTDDARAVERFMREAKQASRLKHPNIVTIYDASQGDSSAQVLLHLRQVARLRVDQRAANAVHHAASRATKD